MAAVTNRMLCSMIILYFLAVELCVCTSESSYHSSGIHEIQSNIVRVYTANIYREKFLGRRLRYYSNSLTSFNPCILSLSGDIHPHPGPNKRGKQTLTVLLINARSLKNKLRDFQTMVYSRDSDIIVVCETWLTSFMFDKEILPSGYDIYRRDRLNDKRGGGVLIAIKSNIKSKRCWHLESACEIIVCEIQGVPKKTKNY